MPENDRGAGTNVGKLAVGAVALGAAVLLSGCVSIGGTVYHEDHSYVLDGAQLKRLAMRLGDGDAEIVGTDAKTISVHEHLSYTKDHKPELHHGRLGDSFSLEAKCPDGFSFGTKTCAVDYRIQMPRTLALQLQDGSGDIGLSGLRGAVEVRTGSGDLRADDLQSGQGRLETQSGSVRVTGGSGPLDLHSASGDITVTGVRSDSLRARTDSGSVRLETVNAPATVDAGSASGDVQVTLPGDQSYAVDATTDSGDRKVSVKTDSASRHRIRAHTASGDVAVTG